MNNKIAVVTLPPILISGRMKPGRHFCCPGFKYVDMANLLRLLLYEHYPAQGLEEWVRMTIRIVLDKIASYNLE